MSDTRDTLDAADRPPPLARSPRSAPSLRIHWPLLLVTLLVLGVIVGLRKAEPGYTDKLAPLQVKGVSKETLTARNFAVTVAGFGIAHAYLVPGDALPPGPRTVGTRGTWVSVVTDLDALDATGVIGARLRTRDGLVYEASEADRPKLPAINLEGRTVAPGLRESGAFFFEVPSDRLAGAHVQFFWGSLTPGTMDSLVDVDLRLDEARAKKLLDDAPPVTDLTDMAP